ncbi:hypothetical protein V1521DRAFT_436250 [Lipomyces starkeyi]
MPAPFDNEQVEYQRALHFITENEPEERLKVHLSHESFIALQEQTQKHYGNEKYPRVDYFPNLSMVRIKTQPSHSRAQPATGIGAFYNRLLSILLEPHEFSKSDRT